MLRLSLDLNELPILSLRTGVEIALTKRPLINPGNLKIEGFYVQDLFDKKKDYILLTQDIREILINGFAVNDHEVLSEPSDLHRLSKVIEENIMLVNKMVITVSRKKIGKVSEFTVDNKSFFIQKIYVSQSIFKNLTGSNLILDRNNIVEITYKYVIVKDFEEKALAVAPAIASY